MNTNPILNWDYDYPTTPGLYLSCYGDIETLDSIRAVRFSMYGEGLLLTSDGLRPEDYGRSYKWAKLVVGSEAKRIMEGE